MSNNNAMISWEGGSLRATMTRDDFIHKVEFDQSIPSLVKFGQVECRGVKSK